MNGSLVATAGAAYRDRIARPIFIVSTPRSGSTLLFETLAEAPELFTTGRESHMRIEQVANFHPARRGWASNRLDRSDATPGAVEELARNFYEGLSDRNGMPPVDSARLLEKTPKNALRVPFFDAAWSDSIFVYLYRDVRHTLASMIEAWLLQRFVTYPRLPGWGNPAWSLLLVPGWPELKGRQLHEIVARQWAITTDILVDDLQQLDPRRVVAMDYADFIDDPQAAMLRLTRRLDLGWDLELGRQLPLSQHTQTAPAPEKWRRFEDDIESVWPLVEESDARARNLLGAARA